MRTYIVLIGNSTEMLNDRYIVRANSVSDAERKAKKKMGDTFESGVHVVKVEEVTGEYVE